MMVEALGPHWGKVNIDGPIPRQPPPLAPGELHIIERDGGE
jgi:hypothetical protein